MTSVEIKEISDLTKKMQRDKKNVIRLIDEALQIIRQIHSDSKGEKTVH